MPLETDEILEILRHRGIEPPEQLEGIDFPEIGDIREGETVYSTSIKQVREDTELDSGSVLDDGRLRELAHEIGQIISSVQGMEPRPRMEPPEPHCAWYCPIHFFGHSWGIYIRESCMISCVKDIAHCIDWSAVPNALARPQVITRQLLRSAFYVFYLHEQFHHKVESLGFRLLIATNSDRYRLYKQQVYRSSYLTADCIEESLANAESYRRLSEARYRKRYHDPAILSGVRYFLRISFPFQPPGYAEGIKFIGESRYRDGVHLLQSQVLDGKRPPITPTAHWMISPNVITSLMDISDDIYVVLPQGARPIFKPTSISPGHTVSSKDLIQALIKHHGYRQIPGGKGSHVKLTKPGAPNIHIPGNRSVVSPGVVKHALKAIGGHPISRLPDLLDGRLAA